MRSGTVENLHDFKGKLDKIKELKIFKKIYAVTLDKCEMSTRIKKRLTIEKDMAILFSYVVNKINRIIMQKMHWRYLRIAGIT